MPRLRLCRLLADARRAAKPLPLAGAKVAIKIRIQSFYRNIMIADGADGNKTVAGGSMAALEKDSFRVLKAVVLWPERNAFVL